MKSLSSESSAPFTDFVRFAAMCAIIFQHSFIVPKEVLVTDYASVMMFFSLKVIAKIGSISFFIISGVLLTDALKRYSTKTYIDKRFKNILIPYLIFFSIYLMLEISGAFFGAQKISSWSELPAFLVSKILGILFFTSYWFIFNYFISIMLLLAFRRYLYEQWFGILLFGASMVYAINIHAGWFIPHHTVAFLGFTFFLWLGANLGAESKSFNRFLQRTPLWKFILAVLVSLVPNLYETFYLIQQGAVVVDSSLKFTNVVYALTVVALLCKVGLSVRIEWFKPREETYPLYLVHPIIIKGITYGLLPLLPAIGTLITIDRPDEAGWLAILLYQVGWFVAIYMLSLMTVKFILASSFSWLFGKPAKVPLSPIRSFWFIINSVRNFKL